MEARFKYGGGFLYFYLFKRLTKALCLKKPNVNVAMPYIIQEIFSNNLNMYFLFKTQGTYPLLIYDSDIMNRPKPNIFRTMTAGCLLDWRYTCKVTCSSRAMVPWKWSGNRYLCTTPGTGLWYVQYYSYHTINTAPSNQCVKKSASL